MCTQLLIQLLHCHPQFHASYDAKGPSAIETQAMVTGECCHGKRQERLNLAGMVIMSCGTPPL